MSLHATLGPSSHATFAISVSFQPTSARETHQPALRNPFAITTIKTSHQNRRKTTILSNKKP